MGSAPRSRNLLIAGLGETDYALFEPHLRRVPLDAGDEIARPGAPIDAICFPENAVVSVKNNVGGDVLLEVGLGGICGMVGWPLLLGVREHAHRIAVEVGGGTALRIEAGPFTYACGRSPAAADLFRRFVHLFSFQLSTAVASNLRDPVEKRLARWLLMCHDRLEGDEIAIGHQQISAMLGVRRATVTDTLHVLEGRRVIRSRRGRVSVLDRAGLELIAGDAYGATEALYRKLIGPFGKGAVTSAAPA